MRGKYRRIMSLMKHFKEIRPHSGVRGTFEVPGSKSYTNRALICAALAKGESLLTNASDSDDTALLANGLNQMGVLVLREGSRLRVQGAGGVLHAPKFPIPVQNAGTTLRFMLSLAALAQGRTVFEGSERMGERPNDDLLAALACLGVRASHQSHSAQYEVAGGGLNGGEVHVRGDRSSQFLSSLLLVAPYARGDIRIIVDGPLASAGYVKMTLEVMEGFGGGIGDDGGGRLYTVSSSKKYDAAEFEVETDASGATYGMAAAAITGGSVIIPRLRLDSGQADIGFARILADMGCTIAQEGPDLRITGGGTLRGVDVDMNGLPDAVPTMAVVALFAEGPTRIRNIGHLRFKESDRLGALERELRKLRAEVVILEDGLEIRPSPLRGIPLETYEDHRLAMAFSLIGLRIPGVTVGSPGCVRKSFPRYWEEFEKISA
jgi:3-phosphoshikimate 1-carboxyvinyltransferase